jgi:hypothetical protein
LRKKTRATFKEKQIGEELLIDIAKYQQHTECQVLVCFIYDTEQLLHNPAGLIRDLENQTTKDFNVKIVINPL